VSHSRRGTSACDVQSLTTGTRELLSPCPVRLPSRPMSPSFPLILAKGISLAQAPLLCSGLAEQCPHALSSFGVRLDAGKYMAFLALTFPYISRVSHSRACHQPSPYLHLIFHHCDFCIFDTPRSLNFPSILHLSSCVPPSSLLPFWHSRPLFTRRRPASTRSPSPLRMRMFQQGSHLMLSGSRRTTIMEQLLSNSCRELPPAPFPREMSSRVSHKLSHEHCTFTDTCLAGVDNSAGKYTWSVPTTTPSFATYGFSISLDSDPTIFQYSFPFHITGLSGSSTTNSSSTSTVTMHLSTGSAYTSSSSSTPSLNSTTSSTIAKPTSNVTLSTTIATKTTAPSKTASSTSSAAPTTTTNAAVAQVATGSLAMIGGLIIAFVL
jgi:hypothetical protein